jgi:hypothetical protein
MYFLNLEQLLLKGRQLFLPLVRILLKQIRVVVFIDYIIYTYSYTHIHIKKRIKKGEKKKKN